jgi:hypothetical protein
MAVIVNFFWLKSDHTVMMHSDMRLNTGPVLNRIFLTRKCKEMDHIYLMRNG